ncbi:MAG: hypothetical protein ACYS5F_01975 [Planctomycetota bacterium]|jgi:hypothetical protein
MFEELEKINIRPEPFEFYTASDLWTDEHTSKQMLQYHLNESIDLSSRNKSFIDCSEEWIATHFQVGKNTAQKLLILVVVLACTQLSWQNEGQLLPV